MKWAKFAISVFLIGAGCKADVSTQPTSKLGNDLQGCNAVLRCAEDIWGYNFENDAFKKAWNWLEVHPVEVRNELGMV